MKKNKKIFTKEIGTPKEWYNEKQLEHFSKIAYQGSIIGFFLGPLGFIIQAFILIYANRALKSSNVNTIKKAKNAKKIAIVYFLLFILINIYVFFIISFFD